MASMRVRRPLRFFQPLPRLSGRGVIEVSDRRFRERLEERRHAVLPLLIPDHREPFDVGEMFYVKLDVLPRCAGVSTVEIGHVEQHAQFSVLPDESLELGHKVPVICFCQLPADVNDEDLPAVFFIELNGHLALLSRLSTVSLIQAHASSPPAVSLSAFRPDSTSSFGSPTCPRRNWRKRIPGVPCPMLSLLEAGK